MRRNVATRGATRRSRAIEEVDFETLRYRRDINVARVFVLIKLRSCARLFFLPNFYKENFSSLVYKIGEFLRSRATICAWFSANRDTLPFLAKCAHARQSCGNHYAIPGATRWRSIFIWFQSSASSLRVRAR